MKIHELNLKEIIIMNKYTNPFVALKAASDTLQSLGADPFNTDVKSSEGIAWQEHIFNVESHAYYEGFNRTFVCRIHLGNAGFDALMEILEHKFDVGVKHFADAYDEHYIEPDPALHIFKLVDMHTSDSTEEGA